MRGKVGKKSKAYWPMKSLRQNEQALEATMIVNMAPAMDEKRREVIGKNLDLRKSVLKKMRDRCFQESGEALVKGDSNKAMKLLEVSSVCSWFLLNPRQQLRVAA